MQLQDHAEIKAGAVVLTTGTFLNGIIHVGDRSVPAGRMGDQASIRLADRMRDFGFNFGRLKTGTPPRLSKKTINWDILEKQDADSDPIFLSFTTDKTHAPQVSCAIVIPMRPRMTLYAIILAVLQCTVGR